MATEIPYVRDMTFEYGKTDRVSPMIRRVVAENPSAFTFHGTGTYIVGHGDVAVIDPGPSLDSHVEALERALGPERVTHIVITHTHCDHSPAARPLKEATGAPTCGFGPHGSGRADGDGEVEEGADRDFVPDIRVRDGDRIEGSDWTLEAVHTPGHTSNHLCYALLEENALFSGDHVMGWSTTVVSPPDGDMRAYMRSLERLWTRSEEVFWPTHGPPVPEPLDFVGALLAHRHEREDQILSCLARGASTIPKMVEIMYADIGRHLHAAAARSVLSHLIHMVETSRVHCDGSPGPDTVYRCA